MEQFLQVLAGTLLAVVLGIALGKQSKDMALILTLLVCCLVLSAVAQYLEPVIDFVRQLQRIGQLNSGMLQILLKAVGVGLLAEIASLICADSGNGALGKAIQFLATAVVLWLTLPLMQSLLEMVQKMLGNV